MCVCVCVCIHSASSLSVCVCVYSLHIFFIRVCVFFLYIFFICVCVCVCVCMCVCMFFPHLLYPLIFPMSWGIWGTFIIYIKKLIIKSLRTQIYNFFSKAIISLHPYDESNFKTCVLLKNLLPFFAKDYKLESTDC